MGVSGGVVNTSGGIKASEIANLLGGFSSSNITVRQLCTSNNINKYSANKPESSDSAASGELKQYGFFIKTYSGSSAVSNLINGSGSNQWVYKKPTNNYSLGSFNGYNHNGNIIVPSKHIFHNDAFYGTDVNIFYQDATGTNTFPAISNNYFFVVLKKQGGSEYFYKTAVSKSAAQVVFNTNLSTNNNLTSGTYDCYCGFSSSSSAQTKMGSIYSGGTIIPFIDGSYTGSIVVMSSIADAVFIAIDGTTTTDNITFSNNTLKIKNSVSLTIKSIDYKITNKNSTTAVKTGNLFNGGTSGVVLTPQSNYIDLLEYLDNNTSGHIFTTFAIIFPGNYSNYDLHIVITHSNTTIDKKVQLDTFMPFD